MSPTTRFAALMGVVALAGVFLPVPVELLLVAILVVVGAVDARYALKVPVAERAAPALVARGQPSPLSISVAYAGSGTPDVRHPRDIRVRQPRVAGLSVEPAEATGGLDASLVGVRRGTHVLPPVALRVTGPLGLWRVDRASGASHEVRVLPDVVTAHLLAAERRRRRWGDPEERRRGVLGVGTEFESVREWSPTDDVRLMNWRATARLSRPMTNQYRVDRDQTVNFLVDAGRLMSAPVGALTRLDIALDAMAVVAVAADDMGDRVAVTAFADVVLRRLPARRGGGHAAVQVVFDLEPLPVDSDYELVFQTISGTKRSLVVVFTDLLDLAAASSLVAAVPVLVRRHAVIIATTTDPDVTRLLTQPPNRPLDVYAASVALQLNEDRETAVARLRRDGAVVVDATSSRLGSACVDAYLGLKARGRI